MCFSLTSIILLILALAFTSCGKGIDKGDSGRDPGSSTEPLQPVELNIELSKENSQSSSKTFKLNIGDRVGYVEFPDEITVTAGSVNTLSYSIYYNYEGSNDYLFKCDYLPVSGKLEFDGCFDSDDNFLSDLSETDGFYQDKNLDIKVQLNGTNNTNASTSTLFEIE